MLDLNREVSDTLKSLDSWFSLNGLKLNISKSSAICFNAQTLNVNNIGTDDLNITLQNKPVKFLGIIIDRQFKWKEHIDYLCNKVSSYSFLLRSLSQMLSQDVLLVTYHAYIASILKYGIIFWGSSKHLIRLFRLQKKCIRNIMNAGYRDTCVPLFKKLKLLSLPSIYIFECACYVKKHFDYFLPHLNGHTYQTRHKTDLYPGANMPYSVVNNLINIYNHVPTDIKNLELKSYKTTFYQYLVNNCFYSVSDFTAQLQHK